MNTQVLFGKSGGNAQRAPVMAPVVDDQVPRKAVKTSAPYKGLDNLNEVDFGRTFASRYAEDSSMLVVFVLWLFFGGAGGHRFYMGNKWIAMAMAGLGTFNAILWITGGFTAYLSYKAGNGVASGGLISALVVMAIHFIWVFFDFFYILVRKFTSR